MKYQWTRKEINLALIAKNVESFLKESGFVIKRTKTRDSNSYNVFGVSRTPEGAVRTITVTLHKTQDSLIIEFKSGDFMRPVLKFSFLISLLGGGALLLNAYKNAEFYQKIEEKFWEYIEKKIQEI